MAFLSINSNIRNSILGFVRHLVSKTLYRSIEILLRPCCDIYVTDVQATVNCVSGTYDITFTLSKSVNMLGNGVMLIIGPNGLVTTSSNGGVFPYNDSNKFTLTDLDLGTTSDTNSFFSILLFLPSAGQLDKIEELTPGVFTIAQSADLFPLPTCP